MSTIKTPTLPLNQKVAQLEPSATLLINERSNALVKEGRTVYKLGFGQSPFPVPEVVVEALKKHAHEKDYLPVRGLSSLREAVANFNQGTLGLNCSAEDVLIAPGSKELLYQIQLAFNGVLLLPNPSWVSYAPQAELAGKKMQWISTKEVDKWCVTPAQLERTCEQLTKPGLLILNYPNNPSGTTYSENQLEALAKVARKYELLVVADEIYGKVHHDGIHHSFAQYYPEGTIVSGGLSKWAGAGGWRLGTFTFPKSYRWLLDAMAVIASETFTSVSTPIQYAAVRAYQGGAEIDAYLYHSRRILKAIGIQTYERLISIGITMPSPAGGFYLFPNFGPLKEQFPRKINGSISLCEALLEETGVALLPGTAFGRPPEELTARLSFVDFDGKQALKMASTDYKDKPLDLGYLEKCCRNVLQATDRLADFLIRK